MCASCCMVQRTDGSIDQTFVDLPVQSDVRDFIVNGSSIDEVDPFSRCGQTMAAMRRLKICRGAGEALGTSLAVPRRPSHSGVGIDMHEGSLWMRRLGTRYSPQSAAISEQEDFDAVTTATARERQLRDVQHMAWSAHS